MTAFARYPRPDPTYQKFSDEQLKVAKHRILSYPQINKLFNNFAQAKDIPYTKSKNKILRLCMQKPASLPKNLIDPKDNTDEVIHFVVDEQGYPDEVILLEVALCCFQIDRWSSNQYNSFKERITSNDYFISSSVFDEIIIAYRISKKFGLENIKYEPPLSNGKNSDILVDFNSKKIYLELTALKETKAEEKINHVFEHIADYIGRKIPEEKPTCFHVWVDTTKLIHKEKHIDEPKSKEMMSLWIDKLHLDELSGCKGIFHFSDLRLDTAISIISDKKLSEYPYPRNDLTKLLRDKNIKKWAGGVVISDIINSPFTNIALENRESFSSVDVTEDALHTTHESLVKSDLFSSITTAELQVQSFVSHIKRKIKYKIEEEQYSSNSPLIFVIKADLWSSMYETDSNDFSKIKIEIEKILEDVKHVSGILLYASDYTNGRFVHNINANKNIKLSDSEIKKLF